MSKLTEIEKTYCRDIVQFFCGEYNIMIRRGSSDQRLLEIQTRLETQITNRFIKANLVTDFLVSVDYPNKAGIRDNIISEVLGDVNNGDFDTPIGYINVNLRYRDMSMDQIRVKIFRDSVSI